MSIVTSPFDYYWVNNGTNPYGSFLRKTYPLKVKQLEIFLLNQAEVFLESAPKSEWIPLEMIPETFRPEVIELLICGTVTFRRNAGYEDYRIIENEDFTKFKLVPGQGTLKKEGFGL